MCLSVTQSYVINFLVHQMFFSQWELQPDVFHYSHPTMFPSPYSHPTIPISLFLTFHYFSISISFTSFNHFIAHSVQLKTVTLTAVSTLTNFNVLQGNYTFGFLILNKDEKCFYEKPVVMLYILYSG